MCISGHVGRLWDYDWEQGCCRTDEYPKLESSYLSTNIMWCAFIVARGRTDEHTLTYTRDTPFQDLCRWTWESMPLSKHFTTWEWTVVSVTKSQATSSKMGSVNSICTTLHKLQSWQLALNRFPTLSNSNNIASLISLNDNWASVAVPLSLTGHCDHNTKSVHVNAPSQQARMKSAPTQAILTCSPSSRRSEYNSNVFNIGKNAPCWLRMLLGEWLQSSSSSYHHRLHTLHSPSPQRIHSTRNFSCSWL